jgi:hypothetical protein
MTPEEDRNMEQASGRPPAHLPRRFRELWQALWEADQRARSRQSLARELGVSTQTLQRILVRGDVPAFGPEESTRVVRSWARTIARLALAFGRDPRTWIVQVGIPWDAQVQAIVRRALAARDERTRPEQGSPRASSLPVHPRILQEQSPLVLAVAGDPSAEGAPGEDVSLERFARRLLAALLPGHPLTIQFDDEGRIAAELLRPGHEIHLAAGLAATLPRRMAGVEFIQLPGRTVSLVACAILGAGSGAAPVTWEAAREALRRGEAGAVTFAGDPGWDHLAGLAGVPVEQILVLKSEERPQWPRLLAERALPGNPALILVALEDPCRRLGKLLDSADASQDLRLRALPGAALASYPLALAVCSAWGPWKPVLEMARDELLRLEAGTGSFLAPATQAAPSADSGQPVPLAGFTQPGSRLQPGAPEHLYCRSCATSLEDAENRGVSEQYCRFCSDEQGNLKPRDEVHRILARWMVNWQGPMPPEEASRRADSLMRAMPAWSEN